jgi:hypothetical protein
MFAGCAPTHQWVVRDVGNPSPYNGTSYSWNNCEVMVAEDGMVWFSATEEEDGETWEQMTVFLNGRLNNTTTQKVPLGIGIGKNESWRMPDVHIFSRNCREALDDFPTRRVEILRLMHAFEKNFGI